MDAERFLLVAEAYAGLRRLCPAFTHGEANRLAHLAAAVWLGERTS